jgi:hypothetical protein
MGLLTLLAIPLLLLLLAAWVGARLPKTHAAASRLVLDAPLDAVWDAVIDFKSYPRWRPGLARVDAGPELDGRSTWFECCGPKLKVQLQFVEFVPRQRLVTRLVGERLPIFGTWTYEFAESAGKTLLTITESDKIYHPLFRFFSYFVLSPHGAMDVFLIALARKFGQDAKPEHLSLLQGAAD